MRGHNWAGIDISPFPLLEAWKERILARPGVQAGIAIPEPPRVHKSKEEEEEDAKKNAAWIMAGQKK